MYQPSAIGHYRSQLPSKKWVHSLFMHISSCYSHSRWRRHPHQPKWHTLHHAGCLSRSTAVQLYHLAGPCGKELRLDSSLLPSWNIWPLCLRVHTGGIGGQPPEPTEVQDIWISRCSATYVVLALVQQNSNIHGSIQELKYHRIDNQLQFDNQS